MLSFAKCTYYCKICRDFASFSKIMCFLTQDLPFLQNTYVPLNQYIVADKYVICTNYTEHCINSMANSPFLVQKLPEK